MGTWHVILAVKYWSLLEYVLGSMALAGSSHLSKWLVTPKKYAIHGYLEDHFPIKWPEKGRNEVRVVRTKQIGFRAMLLSNLGNHPKLWKFSVSSIGHVYLHLLSWGIYKHIVIQELMGFVYLPTPVIHDSLATVTGTSKGEWQVLGPIKKPPWAPQKMNITVLGKTVDAGLNM